MHTTWTFLALTAAAASTLALPVNDGQSLTVVRRNALKDAGKGCMATDDLSPEMQYHCMAAYVDLDYQLSDDLSVPIPQVHAAKSVERRGEDQALLDKPAQKQELQKRFNAACLELCEADITGMCAQNCYDEAQIEPRSEDPGLEKRSLLQNLCMVSCTPTLAEPLVYAACMAGCSQAPIVQRRSDVAAPESQAIEKRSLAKNLCMIGCTPSFAEPLVYTACMAGCSQVS